MITEGNGIGKVKSSDLQRKKLAENSRHWSCKKCGFLREDKDSSKPVIMEEIERLYMVDSKDWKTSSGPAQKGPKLFTAPKTSKKVPNAENKLAQPKPIEKAEAQPGNKNPKAPAPPKK